MPKLLSALIALPFIGTALHFIITAILAGLLALTYTSLSKEEIVAKINFDTIPNQSQVYIAHLCDANGSKIDDYAIFGDQWRMDAGFIKMEYWANVFGVDSKYVLNRIEGRYKNIEDENSKKHYSYQIEEHSMIDNFSFFIDTTYGSSVYQDIKLDTEYTVLKSQTGLLVREKSTKKTIKKKSFIEKTKSFLGF